MQVWVNRIARRLMRAMEVPCVVEKGVIGSEVGTTTEPPHRTGFEVAVIQMNSWDVGITGVQHHRRAGGKPWMPLGLGALFEN